MKELNKYIKITDIKQMLEVTKNIYKDKPAYKIRQKNGEYKIITHEEVRNEVNYLGTALINLGLKNKRIAVIGENRYEWEIAYLSIVCGTGIVVPLDKSLPENELQNLIERSEVEAIFYSQKYEKILNKIINNKIGKVKYLISMDLNQNENGIYSELELIEKGKELVQKGNKEFINAKINSKVMSIMLFTSGTTSQSKIVALSHENICSNLMSIASVLDVNENDRVLSFLPLHHVFESNLGFLFSLYKGVRISFCDGLRHILENFNEYEITFASFVPAIYENFYKMIIKNLEKEGKLEETLKLVEKYRNYSMEEKQKVFKDIYNIFGGHVKLLISGAAALDKNVEQGFRNFGINLVQGYGLTETSPVIGVGNNKNYRLGSIGKAITNVEAKLKNVDSEGIGELLVKGPNIMLEYYEDEIATKEAIVDGWFYTGDLAKIDKDGYIFICGRKKSVIVLKNGKNIFPEELENLVNNIEGVKESFIFGKPSKTDKDNIKIYAKIIYDEETIKNLYEINNEKELYDLMKLKIKQVNRKMPQYKAIKGIILSKEPLIRTTTNKIKRKENFDALKRT